MSSFQGDPQDYLDWFKLGCKKSNTVILPPSSLDEENKGISLPQASSFKLQSGISYSEAYIEKHKNDYLEKQMNTNILPSHKIDVGIEDISTVAETDCGEDYESLNSDAIKAQVYLHYDFTKRNESSQRLPVANLRKEMLQLIERYNVVVIQGETGCGKSTQVPQFILDYGVEHNQHVNIIVTQPRKIAAISLANRVCDERGWKTGTIVGYQVGLNNNCNLDTRLAFVTTEVLVQKIINKKSLNEFTHIILDEIHERDEHADFALLVVKKLLHTVSRSVKIILMSATIDSQKFSHYFSTPVGSYMIPAPVISISEKTAHNIQIYYLEALRIAYPDEKLPPYNWESPGISKEMLQLSVNLIKLFDDLEKEDSNTGSSVLNRGAVLMFLPGLYDIESVIEILRQGANTKRWEIYPVHSSLTMAEQRAVFRNAKSGFRKIIVSTNIAESSITVPDIKYVIDFCLTKVLRCDPVTNYTCLKMAWTSKASCTQRAGRVGRVSSGRVYRLVEECFFEDLPAHSTPELCRTPLSQVVLKIKLLNMGEPQALLALALDPPDLSEIHRTVLLLKQIGALGLKAGEKVSSSDGDLTYLGYVASALPLDPKLSKLIMMGYIFGCLKETIIIAAGLSFKSFYATPFQDELNAFLSKVSWAYASFSDCLAILNTYTVWENFQLKGSFEPSTSSKERDWAKNSYVQLESLKEVQKLVIELNKRLEHMKIIKRRSQPMNIEMQPFFLKICIAGAFYPNYFKHDVPYDYERMVNRTLGENDPFSTLIITGLPADTNVLYENQLQKIFSVCAGDLKFTYEGTRAYMHFPKWNRRDSMDGKGHLRCIPGEFPTAMHLALKMRQVGRLRKKFTLDCMSNKEADKLLGAVVSAGDEVSELPQSRRRAVHQHEVEMSPPVMPLPTEHLWKVHVTHVENAGRFWVVSSSLEQIQNEGLIQSTIEEVLQDDSFVLSKVFTRMLCLAPYEDEEGVSYYRARVEEVEKGSQNAWVFFVDFGNIVRVKVNKLKPFPESLLEIPMLAVECALSEVKPSSSGKGESRVSWSMEATNWLRKRILNQEFEGKIYSVVHNVIRIELYDLSPDPYDQSRFSINELLISQGFASKSEEFFLSKQNHQLRMIYSSGVQAMGPRLLPSAASIITYPSYVPSSSDPNSEPKQPKNPLFIHGPSSPLEMSFVSLTRTGSSKNVKIEPNSVNSTVLDLDPKSPFDRFMVSPFGVLNPSESSIVLRSPTLMPSMPGVLSLCLLMFCPFAELRVNKDKSSYTGALFGLGFIPETGQSVYPDDDIELSFDFKFTQDDLIKVNKLRFLMNSVMEYFDEISEAELGRIQLGVRDFVLDILKDRPFSASPIFDRAYKWNLVAEQEILYPVSESGIEKGENIIWPLHKGIILKPGNSNLSIALQIKSLRTLERSLKNEGYPNAHLVNKMCPLCESLIENYEFLQAHLRNETHLEKERLFYNEW